MVSLVFDFDGVLANTFLPLAVFVAEKFRLSFPRSVGKIIGANLRNNQTNWFKKRIQDYQSRKFLAWLKGDRKSLSSAYDQFGFTYNGTDNQSLLFLEFLEIIENLSQTKYIITNNYLSICEFILQNKTKLFKKIYTYDSHLSKTARLETLVKENNLNLKECLFFVDTVGDILEYRAVLAPEQIFAVSWGYHPPALLKMVIDEKQILNYFHELSKVVSDYENSFLESLESKSRSTR